MNRLRWQWISSYYKCSLLVFYPSHVIVLACVQNSSYRLPAFAVSTGKTEQNKICNCVLFLFLFLLCFDNLHFSEQNNSKQVMHIVTRNVFQTPYFSTTIPPNNIWSFLKMDAGSALCVYNKIKLLQWYKAVTTLWIATYLRTLTDSISNQPFMKKREWKNA